MIEPSDAREKHACHLQNARLIEQFCDREKITLSAFFTIAWSILLQYYTGSEAVALAVDDLSETQSSNGHRRIIITPYSKLGDLYHQAQEGTIIDPDDRPKYGLWIAPSAEGNLRETQQLLQQVECGLLVEVGAEYASMSMSLYHGTIVSAHHQAPFMASTIVHLIEQIAKAPAEQLIRDLQFLCPADFGRVVEWNPQGHLPAHHQSITHLISQQCLQHPEHVAIDAWDGQLSYGQLEQLTTDIATELRQLGVGIDCLVPVCIEKSLWAVVAEISVLKANGAFVPMDPSQPASWWKSTVQETEARLVIGSTKQNSLLLSAALGVPVLVLSTEAFAIPSLAQQQNQRPPKSAIPPVNPEATAYVLFTSGSTAKPKGCVMEHQALADIARHNKALRLSPSRRVLQFSSYTFAVSLIEIYCTLTAGGIICIPSDEDKMNNLANYIDKTTVNWALMTPSTANSLIGPSVVPTLKTLLLAGEPMAQRHVDIWANDLSLHQCYGFSEWSGICAVTPQIPPSGDLQSFGLIPTTPNLWLVDPTNDQRLAPIGAIGELLIEGPSITRGYLNNPEKTSAAIIESPRWLKAARQRPRDLHSTRMYKTGDLVQYLPDGSIRYIARKDTQAKIRGKRVELSEIEHAAGDRCSSSSINRVIAEAVIPAGGDETPILAVFLHYKQPTDQPDKVDQGIMFVRTEQLLSDATNLRVYLPQALPDHMVPTVYIELSYLPLTISGKVDRKVLRSISNTLTRLQLESFSSSEATIQIVPPVEPSEIILHGLFSTVLGIDADMFGIHHSFLRLGGDSIKAMRLAQACRQHDLTLTVADFMRAETISNLVAVAQRPFTPGDDSSIEHAKYAGPDMQTLPVIGKIEEMYPCSPIQEGILLSQAQTPEYYQLRIIWRVQSRAKECLVNADRLFKACNQLIEVHPMLRTRLIEATDLEGSAMQITLPKETKSHVNILQCDSVDTKVMATHRPSDTDGSPTQPDLPILMIHKSETGNVFLSLDVSHTLIDGLSISIIARDLARLYDGEDLASIPRATHSEYIAYVTAQRRDLGRGAVEFWSNYLNGFSPCLLSSAQGREPEKREWNSLPIDLGDIGGYHQFSTATGMTLATVFKLAWSLVLRSFAVTTDVCFGYMTSARGLPLPNMEDAVGPFINMVVCRVQIDSQITLRMALGQIQSDFIDSLAHQHVSLVDVRASLGLIHSDHMFNTSLTFPPDIETDSESLVEITQVALHDPTEFDVMVEVRSDGGKVLATLKHWTHLVPSREANRLARALVIAVNNIMQAPDQLIRDTQVLDPKDLSMMAHRNANLPGRSQLSVHDLIEYQILARPTAGAVCSWDGQLSFQELGDYSTRFSHFLVSQGVGPDVFVPLCLSRSRWTPVAMLAVIKAGGAFVLLDASYPVQRLRDIVDQLSHPGFVITLPEYAKVAAQLTSTVHMVGDGASKSWRGPNIRSYTVPKVQPSTALYAVFTSGSTGKPKGIVVEHGSYAQNALIHMQHFHPTYPRVLQFSGYSFDVSIFEHLTILIAGGCLCIPSEADRLNRLAQVAMEMNVDSMYLTPSVARTILPNDVPNVKTLGFVGEAMNQQDIETWTPFVRLINWYGPAECTVFCGIQPSMKGLDSRNIGWPEGCAFWVTHPEDPNHLVPVGAVGELLVQGTVVSRGYINNPEKDAASFISPPTWLSLFPDSRPSKGDRLYRTGDLVQVAPDGSYLYLGRKDTQVKLRGHRLEVSEVEYHVRSSFDGATDVVAEVIRADGIGSDPVLVVFVGCQAPRADELSTHFLGQWNDVHFKRMVAVTRTRLQDKLPSYMVPTIFFPLSEVPISRSGKTERLRLRQALMALSSSEIDLYSKTQTVKVPVSSKLEILLQKLFAQILKVERDQIGADDDFFRFRGDSIAAMRLVSAARQENLAFTVADVFNHPILCDLAKYARVTTAKETSMLSSHSPDSSTSVAPFSLLPKEESQLQKLWDQALSVCGLKKDDVEDMYPTTALQEGLMALTAQKTGMYTVQLLLSLSSGVDINRLQDAWQSVVDSNAILRTRIVPTEDFGGLQVVVKSESIPWTTIPAAHYPSLETYLAHDIGVPMSFGQRLVRFALVHSSSGPAPPTVRNDQYSPTCYQTVVLSMHHAIHDRWSISNLLQQVDDAYHETQLRYQDFSPFIRHIVGQDEDAVREFWISEFDGLEMAEFPPSTTPILNDSSAAPRGSVNCAVRINLPRDSAYTVSNLIRLAWAIVVSAYTQTEDVVFGLTVLGRGAPVPRIDEMTGPTVATVPFRVSVKATDTVETALTAIQHHVTDLIMYEQTGIQNIRMMSPEAATACDFRSHLGIQPPIGDNTKVSAAKVLSLSTSATDYTLYASYPLLIVCGLPDENSTMDIQVNFDTATLSEMQTTRIMLQFVHVLRQVCATQTQEISKIEVLCEDEMSLLRSWNSSLPVSTDATLHQLVLQRCMEKPNDLAISTSHETVSFAALSWLSERLAEKLIGLGVRKDSIVALCFEKSIWPVIGMMGILRAGATCVNIDPTLPVSRVKQMLLTTNSEFALASPARKQHLEDCSPRPIRVLALSSLSDIGRAGQTGEGLPVVIPDHPAFIIFTSGSTGTPKGIIMEHRNLSTSIDNHGPAVFLNGDSRVLHFASYAFDISVYEVFSTLTRGGCVCIPTEDERAGDLVGFINRQQINWAVMTPSAVKLLDPADVPTLQTVLLGGESLTYDNVREWSHRRLVHGYGPAETTICTVGEIAASEKWVIGTIGPMLGGVGWVTLPSNPDRLAPLGSVGELLIEGPVVTRGYLNQPELTSMAFIEAPAWLKRFRHPEPVGRLYRSGDLVKWTDNGWIRYMGRKDTQVKVRGQRVELGEIEYHLRNQFSGAKEVVAEVVKRGQSALLVAFVCCSQRSAPVESKTYGEAGFLATPTENFQTEAFRACEELKALLPPYMIPSMLLPLRRLPLTKTSKIDRKTLREEVARMPIEMFSTYDGVTHHQGQGPSRAPSTTIEIQLQKIWSNVLNVPCDRIGLDDTFHSLGGESISAMQVVARSRSSGLVVTVANILRSKTIAQLAKCVQSLGGIHDTVATTANSQDDEPKGEFQLSPIQKLFFEIAPYGHNHFNQSFLLRLTRPIDPAQMSRAIKTIVDHHSMLRARFFRHPDGQWAQKVLAEDPVASFSFQCHAVHSRLEVDHISAQSQNLLDINSGPLMAVDMIRVSREESLERPQERQEELYLHLVAHHLVIDFVSWRIIFQDLEDLLSLGRITGLKSSSFQGWTEAQAAYAAATISPELALPFHPPDDNNVEQFWGVTPSENTYAAIHQRSFKLSSHATSVLFGDANKAFDTQAVEIFQAAVLHAFVQTFSDRHAPTIFTEGHGREPWDSSIDLTRTVGWFTTMWPVHVPLTPHDDILEAVRRTKDIRRRVPANGWQYFASRYHNAEGRAKFHREGPVEILFNYVGLYQQLQRADSLFHLEQKDQQPDIAGGLQRFALVDISVSVVNGCLKYTFFTNGSMKHQDRLATWAKRCEISLQEASDRLAVAPMQYTLSNFPLLSSLTYEALDRFTEQTLPELGLVDNEIEDIYPCAPAQRGILLSQAKNPNQYLDVAIWRVSLADGQAVDIPRLQNAWQQVVDHHPILRTVFIPVSGFNYADQVVLRRIQADVEVCELSTPSKPRVFSTQNPLHSRHKLFITKSPDGSVQMELLISHSLIDGGSNPIIQRDLSMAYDEKLSLASSHPPVCRDYISYLQAQQSQLQSSKLYWQKYVNGLEPCLFPNLRALSAEDDDTRIEGTKSAIKTLDLAENLQSFCKLHGLTATNIVHISWALVLRCFTGADDVCFGYLTSGRDIPVEGIEDAVGPFFNLLVRRVHMPQTSSILSILSDTQDALLDNLSHQHYPLADLYHAQGLAGQSLFNTLVSVQQFRVDDHGSNLILEHEGGHDPTEYVLTLSFQLRDDCVRVNLDYNTLFFTESQATTILQSFSQALSHVVGSSSTQVSQASLLAPGSFAKISDWNGNDIQVQENCVSDLILRHCKTQPDRPAVCAWDGSFSYGQLDELSDGLAIRLQSLGVGPNIFVPLCLEKSCWTPVAILATLKAGGAFVLLDVSLPRSRLRAICETLHANVIVSSETTAHLAIQLAGAVITISQRSDLLVGGDTDKKSWNRSPLAGPRDAVYAVFTSGSTGNPKGAVIENWSFSTQISGQMDVLNLNADSRVLQFSSYTFDVAVLDQLCALTTGGCICIPSENDRRSNLAGAAQELQVNWVFLTPSVARALDPSDYPSLQTVCLVGETPRESDITLWSGINCVGGYGPAECSLVITVQTPLVSSDRRRIGVSQRGRTWVVDPQNDSTLLPIGAIGELLVEAPFVSRGYLGDPDKTNQVFIDPPAWRSQFIMKGHPYRFYKTGDLVQYLTDGALRYIGRKDSQVKLRGQRIELGEVETCVNKCIPSLGSSVASIVTLKDGSPPFLVVFLHWSSNDDLQDNNDASILLPPNVTFSQAIPGLRQEMHNQLPSYMVPSVFLPVSTIPLSPTGKTDLRRLQAEIVRLTRIEIETYSSSVGTAPKRSPCSDNEIILHRLLMKALALPNEEDISLDHNFFSVGGDSLTAMRLANLASKEGVQLSVSDIFQYPILSDLARAIHTLSKVTAGPPEPFSLLTYDTQNDAMDLAAELCSISRDDIEDIYPCSPRQENQTAMAEERPGMLIAQYEYELPSHLRPDQLRAIWQSVLDQNPILRTRIIHTLSGITVQVVQKARPINWHYGDCLRRYVIEDASQPMTLGQPLARFALLEESEISYFVLTIHHALYDGWSIPLLMQQVEAAYRGETIQVEPFTVFIRYCLSLDTDATHKFWTSEFSNLKAVPFPDARNATTSSKIEERVTVKKDITIPSLAHAHITLVNIIQLAWSIVVSAYTDSEDVVFGLTTSGRDAPVSNIDLMTGPTFSTVPFRVRILPNQSIQDALLSIQRTAAKMVNFKHTGLQKIRKLNPDTELACSFHTHLIFQVTPDEASQQLDLLRRRAPENFDVSRFARDPLHVDFHMWPEGTAVTTQITFDPLILSNQEVSRFLSQFEHVLYQICVGTIQLIGDVQLVSPDDMTQLRHWNDPLSAASTPNITELDLSHVSDDQGQTAFNKPFKHNSRIGRISPMMGCTSWVTLPSDPSRLAPLGAVGELLIEGVTRDHLKDLGQMAAAYIEPPQWLRQLCAPGFAGRVYRSGDLVRVTDDGSMKFFGYKHTEQHVGRRIELTRVEHHIQPHLATGQQVIADVVLLQGQNKPESSALIAFVQCGESTVISNKNEDKESDGCNLLVWPDHLQFLSDMSIVRARLRASLPSFMIPVAFVPVRRMPLTPGGEIDRLALHDATSRLDIHGYIPIVPQTMPANEDELQIIRLVAEALGLASGQIGIQDNFFDLGGDSVKAMLLSTKARISGLHITVADIYEHQSLRELAAGVEAGMGTEM